MDLMKKTINSYLGEILLSKKRHLLVEGISDKKLLERLIDRLCCFDHTSFCGESLNIQVDLAEIITIPGVDGNRNKVETICLEVSTHPNLREKVRFAGFIDREFNQFDLDNFQDLLDEHYVDGCLVWSRGHSIENYLFEDSILKELFWEILDNKLASKVIQIFSSVFEESMRLACLIGLAAYSSKKLNFIRENIVLEILRIDNSELTLDLQKLQKHLIEKGMCKPDLDNFLACYKQYDKSIRTTDITLVKRLCDGHLGLTFILFTCCCCIEQVYPNIINAEIVPLSTLIGNIRSLKKTRFDRCASWWAIKANDNSCDYPRELFQLLGIVH
jgi:hypothetical protein